jgi:hypothetical protein
VAGSFAYAARSQTVTFTPAAPLALGTTYTVTVTGKVDAAGDVQQVPVSWSFTTKTPEAAIQDLIDQVAALKSGGVLNNGQANSLTVKLTGALAKLAQGQTAAALDRLTSFTAQVADLVATGVIPAADGQSLVDLAQLVIAALQ